MGMLIRELLSVWRIDLRVRDAVMEVLIRDDLATAAEETLGTTTTVYYAIKQSVPRLKAR